eukprot:6192228-Pleurochrysis_carterae.AAC.9
MPRKESTSTLGRHGRTPRRQAAAEKTLQRKGCGAHLAEKQTGFAACVGAMSQTTPHEATDEKGLDAPYANQIGAAAPPDNAFCTDPGAVARCVEPPALRSHAATPLRRSQNISPARPRAASRLACSGARMRPSGSARVRMCAYEHRTRRVSSAQHALPQKRQTPRVEDSDRVHGAPTLALPWPRAAA